LKERHIVFTLLLVTTPFSISLYFRLLTNSPSLSPQFSIASAIILFLFNIYLIWRWSRNITIIKDRKTGLKIPTLEVASFFLFLLCGTFYFKYQDQYSTFTMQLPRSKITIKYPHCNHKALYQISENRQKLKLIGQWHDFGQEFLCYTDYPSKYAANYATRPASFIQISSLSKYLQKTSAETSYQELKNHPVHYEKDGFRIYQYQENSTQEKYETIYFIANDGELVMINYSFKNPERKTMTRKLSSELQVDFVFYTHRSSLDTILNNEINELDFYKQFEPNAMATVRSMLIMNPVP
jgi:hypothetical protein